jgi:hypothetical protein
MSNLVMTFAFKIPDKGLSNLIGYALERLAKLMVPLTWHQQVHFEFLIVALALKRLDQFGTKAYLNLHKCHLKFRFVDDFSVNNNSTDLGKLDI